MSETISFPMPSWLRKSGFASTCIIGGQWGDEAKGKIVYTLAEYHNVIMRYNGGPNAGHTLDNITLHQIPSGILYEDKINIMGQGMVIRPDLFCRELEDVEEVIGEVSPQHLIISPKAHVILKHEVAVDLGGAKKMVGSTGKGIGPTYEQKYARTGLRVIDFADKRAFQEKLERSLNAANTRLPEGEKLPFYDVEQEAESYMVILLRYMGDVKKVLQEAKHKGKKVLFEGAQGALLDIDNGTYPNVTSSNTTRPSVGQTGYYLPVTKALGVFKAPMSRVGKGPFPSEWGKTDGTNETRNLIEEEKPLIERVKKFMESGPEGYEKGMMERGRIEQEKNKLVAALLEKLKGGKATDLEKAAYFGWIGMEFGATTGRARRLGPLDLPLARYVAEINGLDGAIFTKWDVYSGTGDVEFATKYSYNNLLVHERNVDDLSELDFLSLDTAVPMFRRLPGWEENIRGMTEWDQLPKQTKDCIKYAEKAIGVPCLYFSTGPKKNDLIVRKGR
jgi:adenylosuccinate synthase